LLGLGETPLAKKLIEEENFPSILGFEQCQVMNNEEVMQYLKSEFLLEHLEKITSIRYTDERHTTCEDEDYIEFACSYTAPETLESNIEVHRHAPTGTFDREDLEDTIAHEIGHNVYHNMDVADREHWAKISEYENDTEMREDFAECYAYYMLFAQALNNDEYEFMKGKVFIGREYYGRKTNNFYA